jgi:hypothetical protein
LQPVNGGVQGVFARLLQCGYERSKG